MELIAEPHPAIAGYALRRDHRLGLRERLEGRLLAADTVELDLRTIARERLAQPAGRRR
ncbi:MAG TPA: hypothetical protein VFT27_05895 [Actinomycetota bacterium]|nr:hypothetical protein [Actinomycetota bacterium]